MPVNKFLPYSSESAAAWRSETIDVMNADGYPVACIPIDYVRHSGANTWWFVSDIIVMMTETTHTPSSNVPIALFDMVRGSYVAFDEGAPYPGRFRVDMAGEHGRKEMGGRLMR